jgi:sec-independent protein translocase protein TatA
MGSIGPAELIIILVIALLVFGPKKLPEIGRGVGSAIREFRRHSRDLMSYLESDEPEPRRVYSEPMKTAPGPVEEPAPVLPYAEAPSNTHPIDEPVPVSEGPGELATGEPVILPAGSEEAATGEPVRMPAGSEEAAPSEATAAGPSETERGHERPGL